MQTIGRFPEVLCLTVGGGAKQGESTCFPQNFRGIQGGLQLTILSLRGGRNVSVQSFRRYV